jgi:hypothetical protein
MISQASSRLFPDSVTTPKSEISSPSPTLECAVSPCLDWLLNPDKPRTLLNRVLAHLTLAEAKEINPHYRDDIRIAWLTCQWAFDGVLEPHVAASYRVLGVHPNSVWDKLTERRQALLGDEYPDFYDAAGNMRPDVPKKPVTGIPADEGISLQAGVGAVKPCQVSAPLIPSPEKKESA